MSKRSATELLTPAATAGQPFAKASGSGSKRDNAAPDEMGEFEDAWEDEIESDEEVIDAQATEDADGMDVDDEVMPAIEESDEQPVAPDAFIPGRHKLGPDEILEPDDSVYIMRHSMKVTWPCLSFDVLRDNLGDERQRYPATSYLVAGTQADTTNGNEVVVYKLSSLHKTQKDGDDSDSEDENEDDEDENLDEDPIVEYRSIPHAGGVNRIRAQPLPPSSQLPPVSQPYHVASWADTGKVHIWDVRPLMEALDVPGYSVDKRRTQTPIYTVNSHGRAEGFAMDWAATGSSLRLLTGDIHSKIYLTTSSPSGFSTNAQPFVSHTSSVEDLQWSPTDLTVFASCSADQSVMIWDIRTKGRQSAGAIDAAHDSDVNVISWSRSTAYLLLSGGDEGGIKVWDLRNIKKRGTPDPNPTPVASFSWHKAPITSIEWHPTEDAIFAAAGADDQVTMWDLGVEPDDDEMGGADETQDSEMPPQIMFIHQGQNDVKELHWHPQIPGAIISTAADGFNIFKTISV
ncbi:WD40-repeat-containing domain protein [Mycena albidolilacea]|uniref:Glutamate-rich WD repeat-containing protein 1 n=1 Tax=Mycena albidolilacea TaxID=1033008 RepID=A0AAD7AKV9_9AGAR|nr:WD40-repeat-containing domain protein [Mycena albidolilacea]